MPNNEYYLNNTDTIAGTDMLLEKFQHIRDNFNTEGNNIISKCRAYFFNEQENHITISNALKDLEEIMPLSKFENGEMFNSIVDVYKQKLKLLVNHMIYANEIIKSCNSLWKIIDNTQTTTNNADDTSNLPDIEVIEDIVRNYDSIKNKSERLDPTDINSIKQLTTTNSLGIYFEFINQTATEIIYHLGNEVELYSNAMGYLDSYINENNLDLTNASNSNLKDLKNEYNQKINDLKAQEKNAWESYQNLKDREHRILATKDYSDDNLNYLKSWTEGKKELSDKLRAESETLQQKISNDLRQYIGSNSAISDNNPTPAVITSELSNGSRKNKKRLMSFFPSRTKYSSKFFWNEYRKWKNEADVILTNANKAVYDIYTNYLLLSHYKNPTNDSSNKSSHTNTDESAANLYKTFYNKMTRDNRPLESGQRYGSLNIMEKLCEDIYSTIGACVKKHKEIKKLNKSNKASESNNNDLKITEEAIEKLYLLANQSSNVLNNCISDVMNLYNDISKPIDSQKEFTDSIKDKKDNYERINEEYSTFSTHMREHINKIKKTLNISPDEITNIHDILMAVSALDKYNSTAQKCINLLDKNLVKLQQSKIITQNRNSKKRGLYNSSTNPNHIMLLFEDVDEQEKVYIKHAIKDAPKEIQEIIEGHKYDIRKNNTIIKKLQQRWEITDGNFHIIQGIKNQKLNKLTEDIYKNNKTRFLRRQIQSSINLPQKEPTTNTLFYAHTFDPEKDYRQSFLKNDYNNSTLPTHEPLTTPRKESLPIHVVAQEYETQKPLAHIYLKQKH